ncbi:unnamed protein product [Haemonchus placei]|uniref:Secreted protein n=1 Tax=Haemonchus placei TaxID=6290 RepID=A0A0N4WPK5_HAEPC|nr:unnamed protein product [Haemonchus placei]
MALEAVFVSPLTPELLLVLPGDGVLPLNPGMWIEESCNSVLNLYCVPQNTLINLSACCETLTIFQFFSNDEL